VDVDVLSLLVEAQPAPNLGAEVDARLALLLADFVACVRATGNEAVMGAAADGTSGLAAATTRAGSLRDLDDVDWQSLHHPGSVVWPIVLALSAEVRASGHLLREAAWSGYATMATAADILGPKHRVVWHVTATAGALGAAHAAAVMLGLTHDQQIRAMALAAANAGGLVQAARERRGAAVFNRIAAVTLGLASARAAAGGAVTVGSAFDDMLKAMSSPPGPQAVTVRDGVLDAAPRLFPVSGFLQSAVAGAAAARSSADGELRGISVGLSPGALPLVRGDAGGPWWDARLAVLRAWEHADPYESGTPSELDDRHDLVHLEDADVPPGSARVAVHTAAATTKADCLAPPSLGSPGIHEALRSKWQRVLAIDPDPPYELARRALADAGPAYDTKEVWWTL
jgi:hypothetical protein